MGAPKTAEQKELNLRGLAIRELEKDAREWWKEYKARGGEYTAADDALFAKGMNALMGLQRVGLMALWPDEGKPQLATGTVAFGTLAKYTHAELSGPEQVANIGQVFVAIRQFGEKPAIENKRKTLEPEIVE